MAARERWTKEYADQVVQSALTLGRRCRFDEQHALHVADLALQLFRELKPEHQLDTRYELFLRVAALLHETGMFVNNRSYHKHSLYIISNSELFGLTKHDMLVIALVARYHRRAAPRPYHEGYQALDRDTRIAISKLAAILRLADALDSRDRQVVHQLKFQREGNQFIVTAAGSEDLSLERLALRQKGTMFEDMYGMNVVLRESPAGPAA
jgi:exopolyphosphatase/guanosine-5'-triphosphate,3'-diphosphate pyrophosphatase